ncbi:MAG: ABC transporter ATP-binding protein [Oscillospiraceae bacterium]|nr:ABC transporter ATP-binding protein [Oscillospiraceae bacterium]
MATLQAKEVDDVIYEVEHLSFKYSPNGNTVLDDISFSLDKGEVLSILGPNGAGKSTLLGCIIHLLHPQIGEIWLDGKNITGMFPKDIAEIVSFVPQMHTPTFPYTVFNFILMGRASKIGMFERPGKEDIRRTEQVIEEMDLGHIAQIPYTEISGGERQQATIARAVVQDPKVILFDEPTAHLDFGNQLKTLRLIKDMSDRGYAVVFTTHNPDHAILVGGKVGILDRKGRLSIGNADEIITEDRLKKVYNSDLKLVHMKTLGRNVCIYPNL